MTMYMITLQGNLFECQQYKTRQQQEKEDQRTLILLLHLPSCHCGIRQTGLLFAYFPRIGLSLRVSGLQNRMLCR